MFCFVGGFIQRKKKGKHDKPQHSQDAHTRLRGRKDATSPKKAAKMDTTPIFSDVLPTLGHAPRSIMPDHVAVNPMQSPSTIRLECRWLRWPNWLERRPVIMGTDNPSTAFPSSWLWNRTSIG